ncbi:MAG: type II secretion system protein M [Pseudomonadota bacterium]
MKDWWQSLEARERLMVGGLGVFLVAVGLFAFLEPLFTKATLYREQAETAQKDVVWMQRTVQNLPAPSQGRRPAPTGRSLNVIVDQTRGRYGLEASNTQQVGAGQLRVRLENARFDDMVRWLGDLRRDHGITITVANVNQTDVRGTTNATLTLSRVSP